MSAVAAAVLTGALISVVPVAPAAAATDAVSVAKEAPDTVLLGEPADIRLTARNTGDTADYNLSFRDRLAPGVTYVAGSASVSGLGEPQVYTAPDGRQTLVWANVSDLPVGAQRTLRFQVRPAVADLPVGSTFTNTGDAYVNADPRTVPKFDGAGDYTSGASAQATSNQTATRITAIQVEKSEPSPEHELLRGVHDHTTTYTLHVTNNDHHADNDAVLVDYLPAQLEFLGCGTVDNTPGGDVEYVGAPRLDVSTPDVAACETPFSVETVSDPPGLPAGVYTRVEWHLNDLVPGAFRDVVYRAGIPQRANTTDFGGTTPAPGSLGQAANLANNTGPSTRETTGEQALTNYTTVASVYQGPVSGGGSAEVDDSDQVTVTAEDLAVQKSVSPGIFSQGGIATYTLELEASEYVDASDIVLTDTIPNGLCPLGDAGSNYATGAPAECDGSSATGPSLPYETVSENSGEGTFDVTFQPTSLAQNDTLTVTYQARMLASYRGPGTDPTVAGDDYTNVVDLAGTTTTLSEVEPPGGVSTESVRDHSEATILSDTIRLEKSIQPNTGAGSYTCSNSLADYQESADLTPAEVTFPEGSRVCFLLRIDFPDGSETKNAVLTDFLPASLTYETGSAQQVTGNEVTTIVDEGDLTFTLGDASGTNRFVPRGQTFLYRLSGIVNRSASGSTPDVPGNLAKLRWTDTEGTVGFLRDQEDLRIPPPPPIGVTKAANRFVATPPGATGSLADGGTIRAGDVVDYAVTLANGGSAATDNAQPIEAPETWDRLPAGIECADVSAITDGGLCTDPGAPGHPTFTGSSTRSVIVWDLSSSVVLDPAPTPTTYTVNYRVTYPATISANRSYANDVDVRTYQTATNVGTTADHYPAQNVDPSVPSDQVDAPTAHDDHTVRTPQEAVSKTNTTGVDDTTQGSDGSLHYVAVGETVTYTVETTLPAHTTIYDGVLTDAPPAGLRVDSISYSYQTDPATAFGPLPGGWTTTAAPGAAKVTMPAAVDAGAGDDVIRMVVTATATDDGTNITHGRVRTNTATFRSQDEGGTGLPNRSDTSSVTVAEPEPAPIKVVDDGTPGAGQDITFTLTGRNLDPESPATLRPTLFESVLVDCVPAGLTVTAIAAPSTGTATDEGVGTNGCAADRTAIVWQVGDLAWRSPADASGSDPWPTLQYTVEVDPAAAGGATYANTATLTGTSMNGADPDERTYNGPASATVTVPGSAIVKDVSPSDVAVGDRAHFTLEVDLPQDVNFYDATVIDQLPAGIDPSTVVTTATSCEFDDVTGGSCAITPEGIGPSGQRHGWYLGDVAAPARPRTVTITYTAVVQDVSGNTAGTMLTNTANLSWNRSDLVTGATDPAGTFEAASTPDDATVRVTEPSLSIRKSVDNAEPVPGEDFSYSVTVTNATGATVSTAHDVDVQDDVPSGIRVLGGTISNGGVLSGATPAGGTIDWSDVGPLAPGDSITLTYDARLASPASAAPQTNTAEVTDYSSLDDGGRHYTGPQDTAEVTAGLPSLEVEKTVLDGPPAYRGEPTRWQVVVTNTGPAVAHDVDVVDTLPPDWTYDDGSARVTTPTGGTDTIDPTVAVSELTWRNLDDLATTQSITIVFSATPTTTAAVGSGEAHVNHVDATARDLDDGEVVTTDSDEAQTRIDSADVTLDKQSVGTPVAGEPFTWRLSVANDGADTATGPFTVSDTLPVPVTGVTAAGTGWTCTVTPPAAAGDPSTLACVRTDPADTLASGASLPTITVAGTVPADLEPGTTLHNEAAVTEHTHDPDRTNNEHSTDDDVTAVSDLGIAKSLTGDLVPGATATYTLATTNAGPSEAHGPIVVTDTLPSGLSLDSWSGTGWRLDRSGQTLTFTWEGATPVPLGALPQISVTVSVDSSLTSAVTNTAQVTEPTDPTTGPEEPDSDSVTTAPAPSADLGIAKSHIGAFKAGENGVYELTVTDFGPSDAAGPIVVTDTLPTSLTYESVSSTDGWTCSAAGQDVTCSRAGSLAAGDSTTFRITVSVDEALTGDVHNTAAVDGPTPDPNPANDTDADDTGITVEADLGVDKVLTTDPVVAGEDVQYTIAVANNGSATSPGPITVTDPLPAGLTFVSASGTDWSCGAADGLVTCSHAGALGAHTDAATITVVAHVGSGVGTTTVTNTANVTGPAVDPVPGNNTDSVPTEVTEDTEISVTKTLVSSNPVRAGEDATFDLVVSNSGSSDAREVGVTDVLPAGMTLVSIGGAGWDCTAAVCSRDRVAAGGSAPTLTVVATVASGTPDGTTLTNTASVTTVTDGDSPAGNTADADVDVVAQADLQITKEHPGSAVAGLPTSFTITVKNNGPSDSVGPTTVVDHLPAGLAYLSAGAPWSCAPDVPDASTVRCTVAQGLTAGAKLPALELQAMVDSGADSGTVTNSATVSSPTTDPVTGNNTDTADVDVDRVADLSIEKSHTGPVRVGDGLAFTLTVHNDGPSQARRVVVTDELPAGLDFVSADGTGWTCDESGRIVTCVLAGPLGPGETAAPITVGTGVTPGAYPEIVNVASVASETADADPDDNEAADPVTVPPLVDLSIAKSHAGDLVVGEQASYTLTVTNEGPTAAPGPITVTDALPAGLELVSASGTGWDCPDTSGVVTCVRNDALDPGDSTKIAVVVDVLPAAYPAVINTAAVTSASEDTDPDNDSASDPGKVVPTVELGLEKSVLSASGTTARYQLTVTNEGPSDTVRPVRLHDPLPSGLAVSSAAGTGWSCSTSARRVDCVYADPIPAGSSRSVRLAATVSADAGAKIVNVADVDGGGDSRGVSDGAAFVVPDDGTGPTAVGDGHGDDPSGLLPDTGGAALALVPLGLLLVLAGGWLLSRRRRDGDPV